MRSLPRTFWIILALALLVRLIAAAAAPHPGIADSNHYYNLARNLADGRGFVIDYIWQYHNPPDTVTHPTDYWMPLPAIPPAVGLLIAPDNLFAALVPSVIVGTLIVALTYFIAQAAGVGRDASLMAMLGVVFLPEFVLNSARTDTTMLYVLFVGMAGLCFYAGVRGKPWLLFVAGACGALAQLSRQDGIILAIAMIFSVVIYWRLGELRVKWRYLLLIPLGWGLVLAPWLLRNYTLYGALLPSGASRTMFMTSFIDQFTYGRELTLDHYLSWGTGNIVANIVTQVMGNIRMSYHLLDVMLPVTAAAGVMLMVIRRQRRTGLMLVVPAVTVLGLFLSYSFLTPFHSMGGSYKKSYMLLIPFLAMAGGYAMTQLIVNRRWVYVLGWLMAAVMLANSFQLVRLDFAHAAEYDAQVREFLPVIENAGDVNGDGVITLMAQDPYMFNYYGYPGLMIPSDPRDMILDAAYRYGVDYIVMPPARASLDPIYAGDETDSRLALIPGTDHFGLLRVLPSDAP